MPRADQGKTLEGGFAALGSGLIERLAAVECANCPELGDWLLDLLQAFRGLGEDPEGAVRTFLAARERLERHCYLASFRLRRILEAALEVEVAGPSRVRRLPLSLHWRDLDRLRTAYRRDHFEHSMDDMDRIAVRFLVAAQ